MDEWKTFWFWYDFKNIAGSAVMRSQNVDGHDASIDWERQTQAMRAAGLSMACSLLEGLSKKHADKHAGVLAYLRNAVLHNGGDISKNNGHPKPLDACQSYLADNLWLEISPQCKRYFLIRDNMVWLEASLFWFIERLFDSYMSEEQRKKGAPYSIAVSEVE